MLLEIVKHLDRLNEEEEKPLTIFLKEPCSDNS